MLKNIIEYIIGLVFIASGIAKLFDFSNTIQLIISVSGFDFPIVKAGLILLSFLEIFIGLSFLINFWDKPFVVYCIFSLTGFFILLNLFFIFKGYANCGCFGTHISSSPILSLIKNTLIMSYLFYAKYSGKKMGLTTQ
jgi:uncharacterized membrane protein YphA (DoxX/SURF4 family)